MKIKVFMELTDFVRESNKIEGIVRGGERFERDFQASKEFLALDTITIPDLENLVNVFQPGAKLRDKPGMDVRVGNHIAPPGGPEIVEQLEEIIHLADFHGKDMSMFEIHQNYESLHPFMDGNGRSGRMLWLWQMEKYHGGAPLGFLHHWYYQSLKEGK
jgi:hypothetical protein